MIQKLYLDTVATEISSALDLHFSNISVASLDKELEDCENSDLGLSSQRLLGSSAPVNIPGSLARSSSLHSSSSLFHLSSEFAVPVAVPVLSLQYGSPPPADANTQVRAQRLRHLNILTQLFSNSYKLKTTEYYLASSVTALAVHRYPGLLFVCSADVIGLNGVTGSIWDFVSGSFSPSPSPVFSSGTTSSTSTNSNGSELSRVRRELDDAKRKIKRWEDSWQQVKQACDAWQKEAQEAKERAKAADAERQVALIQKEEAEGKLKKLQEEFDVLRLSPQFSMPRKYGDVEKLPLPKLHSLKSQLCSDLETIDGLIFQLHSQKCVVCRENDRSIVLQPCQHYVLCELCASSKPECPYCKTKRMKW
ncbi:unnamed protein product [Ranitomeya imitator]|uniref:RING-type domain-containing protein n=1 Tax=Ranitomeya imitator TaxID=111125 RepID=A0ABN9KW06_9NEOB|nr:unnamed protein product [Ranitomeya imitator]